MLQKEDSIQHVVAVTADTTHTDTVRHEPLTPAKVIGWLPKDATPAQQDSIVQAHFKPDTIHWSAQPDTLHLPGLPAKEPYAGFSADRLYNENYFTGKPFYHPELVGGHSGTVGDNIPYSISRDNVITIMLIVCFMMSAIGLSAMRGSAARRVKMFFRARQRERESIAEAAMVSRFQLFLSLQTFLLMGMVCFQYVELHVANLFSIDNNAVIAVYSSILLAYSAVKGLLYRLTGYVFFTKPQTLLWMQDYLFILCSEGLLMFPVVLLQTFFQMPADTSFFCAIAIVCIGKLLAFYKTYVIFFRQNKSYLQNILYLCTLELIPLAVLAGVLGSVTNYLKVSF